MRFYIKDKNLKHLLKILKGVMFVNKVINCKKINALNS